MNVSKIQKLSEQCRALQIFKDRCTWESADFSVGDCSLDDDTSKRVNSDIQMVIGTEIGKIQVEIKKEVGV